MGWYNSAWQYRKQLTIDHTKVGAFHTNFPVLIDLSTLGNDFFSNVKSDGSDIVITSSDGVTKLSRELVAIDTVGKTGELWVNVPSLSNSADTSLYIYFGNSSGAETNATATWNSNYVGILHMQQNPGGTAPQMLDSTANGNSFTSNGAMGAGNLVAGEIGKNLNFVRSSSQYLSLSSVLGLTGTNATVSAWVNIPTASEYGEFVGVGNSNGYKFGVGNSTFSLGETGGTAGNHLIILNEGSIWLDTGINIGTGRHLIHIFINSSGYPQAAIDGVSVYTNSTNAVTAPTVKSQIGGDPVNSGRYWNNQIDEVHFAAANLDVPWALTEFNNQSSPSTFYSVGILILNDLQEEFAGHNRAAFAMLNQIRKEVRAI